MVSRNQLLQKYRGEKVKILTGEYKGREGKVADILNESAFFIFIPIEGVGWRRDGIRKYYNPKDLQFI